MKKNLITRTTSDVEKNLLSEEVMKLIVRLNSSRIDQMNKKKCTMKGENTQQSSPCNSYHKKPYHGNESVKRLEV